jgi:hypothetical protein
MKIYNKFVESKKEPLNKNDIWFDGSVWKMFSQGEWEAFTVEKEAATKINKLIEDSFGVYQEKLTAGDGVIIENNIISTEKLYQVVKTLPDKGKHNTIYLVSSKNTEENNILTEYIWINNDWEKLGEFKTDIDLTSYLTKTGAQITYQPQEKGKGLSSNDYTDEDKAKLNSLENYDDSGIKEELTKKADKSEIPTKMSQLEQDVEIGSSYDDTELKEEIAETYATKQYVEDAIQQSGSSVVKTTPQTLSNTEKNQVRNNIYAQEKLVSGVNIATINNKSILKGENINLGKTAYDIDLNSVGQIEGTTVTYTCKYDDLFDYYTDSDKSVEFKKLCKGEYDIVYSHGIGGTSDEVVHIIPTLKLVYSGTSIPNYYSNEIMSYYSCKDWLLTCHAVTESLSSLFNSETIITITLEKLI